MGGAGPALFSTPAPSVPHTCAMGSVGLAGGGGRNEGFSGAWGGFLVHLEELQK